MYVRCHQYYKIGKLYPPLPAGADATSFTYNLITTVATDTAHVWFGLNANNASSTALVKDADSRTFTVLYTQKGLLSHFAKDKNTVYFNDYPPANDSEAYPPLIPMIAGLKPGSNDYVHPDPLSFMVLGDGYTKDKDHVYFDTSDGPYVVAGADPQTFALIYAPDGSFSGYARDKSHLYNTDFGSGFSAFDSVNGTVIDPATFTVLGGGYTADKNTVYFNGKQIPGADPASFTVISTSDMASSTYNATDKYHKYENGKVVR